MGKLGRALDRVLNTPIGARLYDATYDSLSIVGKWKWRKTVQSTFRAGLRNAKDLRNWFNQNTWLSSVGSLGKSRKGTASSVSKRIRLRASVFNGLKIYYEPLDENFRPPVRLDEILEASGIEVSELGDSSVHTYAFSWWEGEPKIALHPSIKLAGSQLFSNNVLCHELFHLTFESGSGLCEDYSDPREVLADRFAKEVSLPMPAAVQAAKRDVEILLFMAFDLEELLRATDRLAFVVHSSGTNHRGWKLTIRAPSGFLSQRGVVSESWDSIFASALRDVRPPLRYAHAHPRPHPDTDSSILYYVSKEGLYYSGPDCSGTLELLAESGLFDVAESNVRRVQHYSRTIPDTCVGDITIHGGNFFVASFVMNTFDDPADEAVPIRQFFVIEDREGELTRSWEIARRRGEAGPVLLPNDPLNLRQPKSFGEWRSTLEGKFFGRDSLSLLQDPAPADR